MTNQELVKARLADARQFLEYAKRALVEGFYHHTVQFAQRAAELALKALLAHEGKEAPHAHDLAKMVGNLTSVRGLAPEAQSRFYESNRNLAKHRISAIYGAEDGLPPSALFDKAKADEALEQGHYVVETVAALVEKA